MRMAMDIAGATTSTLPDATLVPQPIRTPGLVERPFAGAPVGTDSAAGK